MKKQRSPKARLLAVLGSLALMAGLVVPFHASAATAFGDLYEGWKHISKDAPAGSAPSEFVSYNEETGTFTFTTVESGSQEMLFLNREYGDGQDSSADNIAKFGKSAMSDFVVEYDVELTAVSPSGGMIEFAFMNERPNEQSDEDLAMGSISAGNTDAHTLLWSRGSYWRNNNWVNIPGQYGAGDLAGYYGKAVAGTGKHHMKVTKSGWNLTIAIDDEAPVSYVIDESLGLPSSGYMGFYAKGADAVISNVQVTNSTSGETDAFFAPPAPPAQTADQYEGWSHLSKDAAAAGDYVSYNEETGAFSFNTKDSGSQEMLFLNRDVGDGKDSSAENIEKFNKSEMKDFVVEYDVELTETGAGGGWIEFAFMNERYNNVDDFLAASISGGNTDVHTLFWNRGAYWIDNKWINLEGGGYGDLGGYYNTAIAGTGLHHMKIEKEGWTLTMTLDGGAPVSVELPSDLGLPESGYMGFFAKGANGTISNVKITNSTTGETGIFFGDGESDVQPGKTAVDLEGWTGFCNEQTEAVSHYYQRDGEGALFFDGMYCGGDFLYLNSPYGTSADALDNAAKFGADAMGNFTVDFDFSLRDMDSAAGGALNFAFGAESEINPGLASTVLQMNGSSTAFKYEYFNLGNYGLLPNTHPENVLVGNDTHHVTITKSGRNVNITIDGYTAWENYTLPETITANNGVEDHPAPDSGYMAFWFRNAKGYIANVVVTNDTTGESKTFFEDYSGSLDYWEMGGGDTTNLLAVTPEKGVGVRGQSVGESPDNTTLKYLLPLDLTDLTFDFVPKAVTTVEYDPDAWMGFALTDTEKDYNPEVPAKSAGFVAEIQTREDRTAVITFKSLLIDEEYGTHTATYELDEFRVDSVYTFGTKYTEAGMEIYLDGEKIATLDWLKGVYRKNLGYLTTTASCTDGFPQEWAVMAVNGENAIDYDSGLFDDGFDDGDDDGGNTGNDGESGDPTDGSGENPDTGVGFPLVAAGILAAAAALALGALRVKARKS